MAGVTACAPECPAPGVVPAYTQALKVYGRQEGHRHSFVGGGVWESRHLEI